MRRLLSREIFLIRFREQSSCGILEIKFWPRSNVIILTHLLSSGGTMIIRLLRTQNTDKPDRSDIVAGRLDKTLRFKESFVKELMMVNSSGKDTNP